MLRMKTHLNNASFIKGIYKQEPYIFLMTVSNLIYTVVGNSAHSLWCLEIADDSNLSKRKQTHK